MKWVLFFSLFQFSFQATAANGSACTHVKSPSQNFQQVQVRNCEEIKKSPHCQQLYKKIKEEGEDLKSKELNCQDRMTNTGMDVVFNHLDGCLIGGVFDPTFGVIGRALGEGAAQEKIELERKRERLASCDKSLEHKQNIFRLYNESVPKILNVAVPADSKLKEMSCEKLEKQLHYARKVRERFANRTIDMNSYQLKGPLSEEQIEYIDWQAESEKKHSSVRSGLATAQALWDLAYEKLGEMGVRLECYNQRAAAALSCEILFSIASAPGALKSAVASKTAAKVAPKVVTSKVAPEAVAAQALPQLHTSQQKEGLVNALNRPDIAKRFLHAEAVGDPHISFLKELGVRRIGQRIEADPDVMINNLNRKTDQLVKNGVLKESEVLRPAKVYKNPETNQLLIVRYDEVPPPGYVQSADGIVPENLFWEGIEKGLFAVGRADEDAYYTSAFTPFNLNSEFMHDLSHFGAFHQEPELMKSFREAARHMKTLDPVERTAAERRMFVATELLITLPKGSAASIDRLLSSINFKPANDSREAERMTHALAMQPDRELLKVSELVSKARPDVNYLGGVSRDPLSRVRVNGGISDVPQMAAASPLKVFDDIEKYINVVRKTPNNLSAKNTLADLVTTATQYLHQMKDQSAAKITSDIAQGNKEAPIFKAFCSGRMGTYTTTVRNYLCK
ncbi:MAG: hypothetical protein ACAH59_02560 [Pseudobdellovibrionaceae bacterium]